MSKNRMVYVVAELAGANYIERFNKVIRVFSSESTAELYAFNLNTLRDKSIEAMNKLMAFSGKWHQNHRHLEQNAEKSVLFHVARQDFIELSGISMVDLESYYDLYDRVFDVQAIEFEDEE